ncbi:Uma2 family endonuclease [Sedimentibacter sp. zth1]|uniref:Uma2 family endonuclease n=1 Tax=Sedimentibacter sp. zth1 TaxID=2816908 RepID=UPI001A90DC26|nr:Uma2 family endonuclease [Sedimentibacter sp. zth1]QSX06537.1 Uma2 family endonuclease [Sedimentibacter sp. zth1]
MHAFSDAEVSIQEFDEIREDKSFNYELIDGIVCMSSKTNLIDKSILMNLSSEISFYLKGKPYRVFSDIEVEINNNVFFADICVVKNLYDLNTNRLKAIPIIIIEMLNTDKTVLETEDKINNFKNFGVKEYWILNPKNKSIYIVNLQNETMINYFNSINIKSDVLVDFSISMEEIFDMLL